MRISRWFHFFAVAGAVACGTATAVDFKAAPPDGHTLMMGTSVAVTELVTQKDPEFDVRRDMAQITNIA